MSQNPIEPSHVFVRPGQVAPELPAPDACMVCGQPERAHIGPELAGRITAARAVVRDYRREAEENPLLARVHVYWAPRLASVLSDVLDGINQERS